MFLQGIPRKGHLYYAVYRSQRKDGKVVRELKLYIGRLDGGRIDRERQQRIERRLIELGGQALVERFRRALRKADG